jgi:hypothetical protein
LKRYTPFSDRTHSMVCPGQKTRHTLKYCIAVIICFTTYTWHLIVYIC